MKPKLLIPAIITLFVLLFAGCQGTSKRSADAGSEHRLGIGETLKLAVDYGTRKITRDDTHFQAEFRLEKSGNDVALVMDCSRLGGGLIRGICLSYQGNEKLREENFSVHYQHSEKLRLPESTDSVLLSEITFIHIIE